MYSDSFEHLRDVHDREIAIIIGNGPSLKTVPLSFLQKYPSFGANRISLRIINLTEGSDLTVFEIGNVCDWS